MADTLTWNMGMAPMRRDPMVRMSFDGPPAHATYGGMKIIESDHVPADKAFIAPGGEMIVPRGMADKILEISSKTHTADAAAYGLDVLSSPIVVNRTTTATTSDGTTLTLGKLEEVIEKIKSFGDTAETTADRMRQLGQAFGNGPLRASDFPQILEEDINELVEEDVEMAAMEGSPGFGSF